MRKLIVLFAAVAALAVAGCTSEEVRNTGENAKEEAAAINNSLDRLLDSQPVPAFDWSQERQTVIDVLTLRAQGATTTALFQNMLGEVVYWCPASGAPVPATNQLTKSQTPAWFGEQLGSNMVDQMEPTGDYVGDTDATWTVCVDDNGKKFGVYWENPVAAVTGTLDDLPAERRFAPTDITFEFTEE